MALLSRLGEIRETRRGLPGDAEHVQSRSIEAAVSGVLIAGLHAPNGNPKPGLKFDYKLRCLDRLDEHLASLVNLDAAVIVAGDFNVIPADADVYAPERWQDDALFAPEVRGAYQSLLDQGWSDAIRYLHPRDTFYTFCNYWRARSSVTQGYELPSFAEPGCYREVDRSRGRYRATRLGKNQRSCTSVDRTRLKNFEQR